jgi:hypothetical protein
MGFINMIVFNLFIKKKVKKGLKYTSYK